MTNWQIGSRRDGLDVAREGESDRGLPPLRPLGRYRVQLDAGGRILDGDRSVAGALVGRRLPMAAVRMALLCGAASADLPVPCWPDLVVSVSVRPCHDHDGRLLGLNGTAEIAPAAAAVVPAPTGPAPDTLRQLTHELRTPLTAIIGFAELIREAAMGPVSEEVRARADSILAAGTRLIEVAERIDRGARARAGGAPPA